MSTKWATKADAIFQMHDEIIWRNPKNRNDPGHYNWLNTQKTIPVYMQSFYADVPMSVRYPLDEVAEKFKVVYFTSSVAYALALACYFKYDRIELYGVEMETNTEYQYQRDCIAYWLGVARGLGIVVDAHISLFDQVRYGYDGEVVLQDDTFEKRIAEIIPTRDELEKNYETAAKELVDIVDEFGLKDNTPILLDAIKKQIELSKELGVLDGMIQENTKYKDKAAVMKEMSGGFLFSRQEFESAAAELTKKMNTMQTEVVFLGGQGELLHQSIRAAAKDSPKRHKLLEGYKAILRKYLQAHNQAMIYTGATQENFRYMAQLDKSIRAAGGAKSEAVMLEALKNG